MNIADLGKIGICIQARVSSSRLPGKVLYQFGSSKFHSIKLIVSRLRYLSNTYPFLNNIYILTTDLECDNSIVEAAGLLNCRIFRGSSEDVLSRYYKAAAENNLDTIIRITSDCPFIDPREVIRVLEEHANTKSDYTTNSFSNSTIVDGFDVEVFSFSALKNAFYSAKLPSEREHVTFYFKNGSGFECQYSNPPSSYDPSYRLTLDTSYDYVAISRLVDSNPEIVSLKMCEIIDKYINLELFKINAHLEKNHGWISSFEKDNEFNKISS